MARELTISVKVDGSQAKRELNAVEGELKDVTTEAQTMEKGLKVSTVSIGKVLGTVATGIAALKIGDAAAQAVAATSRIADATARLGIGAEAVQKLEFALTQSGSSLESLAVGLGRMSAVLVDGTKETRSLLQGMGLDLDALRQMKPEEAFIAMAEGIRQIPDPMRQSAAAIDLFGRGGTEMLPAIKAGLVDIGNQAPLMSAAMVQSGDEIGDKMAALHRRIDTLKAQALLPLASFFVETGPESVQIGAAGLLAFMPSMETLVLGIFAAGGPVAALGALKAAALAVGAFFSTTLPALFAGTIAFFTTTLPAAFAATIAFLGPQGLIALAVLALLAIWYFFGDEISAVVSKVYTAIKTWLVDKWGDIKAGVSAALTSVAGYFTGLRDRAVELARLTYEGVKRWLVDQLTAIVQSVKGKIDAVVGYFKGMYDAVVGQSYVPEMVQRIGDEFGTLDARMVAPTNQATSLVQSAFRTMASAVEGLVQNMIAKVSGLLTSWADKFLPSWAAQLVGGLANSALGNLVGRIPGLGGGGLTQLAGGIVPGLLGAGGASSAAASVAGIDAQIAAMSGAGTGGGLGSLGGLLTNPWTIGIAAAIGLGAWGIPKLVNKFRGGEEGTQVNPARDVFLSRFSEFDYMRDANNPAGFYGLAKRLTEVTGEEGGGELFRALNRADTMKEFEAAVFNIEQALANSSTGAIPALQDTEAATASLTTAWTDTEAQLLRVTPVIQDLTASLGTFGAEVEALRDRLGSGGGIPPGVIPFYPVPGDASTGPGLEMVTGPFTDDGRAYIEGVRAGTITPDYRLPTPVEGFATGTMGRFVDFGDGRMAVLHHKEGVVRPGDPVPILNGEGGGRGGDVTVHLGPGAIVVQGADRDGREIAEEIYEGLIDQARRNTKGRRTRLRLALGVSRADPRRPGASPWE